MRCVQTHKVNDNLLCTASLLFALAIGLCKSNAAHEHHKVSLIVALPLCLCARKRAAEGGETGMIWGCSMDLRLGLKS